MTQITDKTKRQFTLKSQNLHFKFKKTNFKYRYDSIILYEDFKRFESDFTEPERLKLVSAYPDFAIYLKGLNKQEIDALLKFGAEALENKDADELKEMLMKIESKVQENVLELPLPALRIKLLFNEYEEKRKIARELFFKREDNAKRLFALCLDGNVDAINFDVDTDEAIIEFDDFITEVLDAFFLSNRNFKT